MRSSSPRSISRRLLPWKIPAMPHMDSVSGAGRRRMAGRGQQAVVNRQIALHHGVHAEMAFRGAPRLEALQPAKLWALGVGADRLRHARDVATRHERTGHAFIDEHGVAAD